MATTTNRKRSRAAIASEAAVSEAAFAHIAATCAGMRPRSRAELELVLASFAMTAATVRDFVAIVDSLRRGKAPSITLDDKVKRRLLNAAIAYARAPAKSPPKSPPKSPKHASPNGGA